MGGISDFRPGARPLPGSGDPGNARRSRVMEATHDQTKSPAPGAEARSAVGAPRQAMPLAALKADRGDALVADRWVTSAASD